MAIEPLGSIMSFQAQTVSEPVQKTEPTMEGQESNNVVSQVDASTLAVKKAENNQSDEGEDNQQQEKDGNISKEMIRETMKELNKKATNVEAEFGIHEKTNRITIKMVDKKTKEVIKELPPEKMLDMIAKVWEMAGLVVDEKR